jgi:hypothetical protein
MLGKDGNFINEVKALDVFMALPDDLVIDMIKYDREGILIMCIAMGVELSNKTSLLSGLAN